MIAFHFEQMCTYRIHALVPGEVRSGLHRIQYIQSHMGATHHRDRHDAFRRDIGPGVIRRNRSGHGENLALPPLVAYLRAPWQAACANVGQLKRKLDAQGYRRSYSLMMLALSRWSDFGRAPGSKESSA